MLSFQRALDQRCEFSPFSVAAVALAGFAQIALLATGARRIHLRRGHVRPARTARVLAWIPTLDHVRAGTPFAYRLVLRLSGCGPAPAPPLCYLERSHCLTMARLNGHGFDFVSIKDELRLFARTVAEKPFVSLSGMTLASPCCRFR